MDIFHPGKEEAGDDHRFINERILEVAVPEDADDGRLITLEGCLENYFNNRIEVKRYLERRNTLKSKLSRRSASSFKGQTLHIETAEVEDSQTPITSKKWPFSPSSPKSPGKPLDSFTRNEGIVRDFWASEKSEVSEISSPSETEIDNQGRPRAGSMRKEIMLPAWQFFNLIPWYTDNSASNDAQVASHFASVRPVLGICLKRYSVLPSGQPIRRDTHIDIPVDIGLPNYIQDDVISEHGPTSRQFKLSLQSAICHRGNSVDSGHYVSLTRCQEPTSGSIGSLSAGISSDGSVRERWMRFDDLAAERIAFVKVEEFLSKETPYLLFYQVQPVGEEPVSTVKTPKPSDSEELPPYTESDNKTSALVTPLGSHNSLETKTGSAPFSRSSTDKWITKHELDDASIVVARPNSIVISDTLSEVGTTYPPSNKSINSSITDSKYLTASADSRGRPASRGSDRRLSRSLSKFKGRLKKDKTDDSSAIIVDRVNGTGSNSPTTEASKINNQAQGNGEGKDKRKHKDVHGGNTTLDQHHRLVKVKKKPEKPDRECSIM